MLSCSTVVSWKWMLFCCIGCCAASRQIRDISMEWWSEHTTSDRPLEQWLPPSWDQPNTGSSSLQWVSTILIFKYFKTKPLHKRTIYQSTVRWTMPVGDHEPELLAGETFGLDLTRSTKNWIRPDKTPPGAVPDKTNLEFNLTRPTMCWTWPDLQCVGSDQTYNVLDLTRPTMCWTWPDPPWVGTDQTRLELALTRPAWSCSRQDQPWV